MKSLPDRLPMFYRLHIQAESNVSTCSSSSLLLINGLGDLDKVGAFTDCLELDFHLPRVRTAIGSHNGLPDNVNNYTVMIT